MYRRTCCSNQQSGKHVMARKSVVKQPNGSTRARIVDFAATEFALRTYAGARVDEIARTSGMSKTLIYYYFKSKEDLFEATLEHVYVTLRSAQAEWLPRGQDPVATLKQFGVQMFYFLLENDWIIKILNDENLYYAEHAKKAKSIQQMYADLITALTSVIVEGQKSAAIRKDVDPLRLYITISAMTYYYISNRHTMANVFPGDLFSTSGPRIWSKHISSCVERLLTGR